MVALYLDDDLHNQIDQLEEHKHRNYREHGDQFAEHVRVLVAVLVHNGVRQKAISDKTERAEDGVAGDYYFALTLFYFLACGLAPRQPAVLIKMKEGNDYETKCEDAHPVKQLVTAVAGFLYCAVFLLGGPHDACDNCDGN